MPIALVYRPFSFTIAYYWGTGSLWLLKVLCGITYDIKGKEYIPQGAALVASKHQSAWDTVIFWVLLKRPAYVLKRELIFFPIFGWYLILLRNIYIDRSSGSKALKQMITEAKNRVEENRPIVIFPEGTRTVPGTQTMYHPGVAALYQQLNVPVIPVALNSGRLWPRNAFVKTPGKITIEFMSPIAPGLRSRDFLTTLQDRIERETAKLYLTDQPAVL